MTMKTFPRSSATHLRPMMKVCREEPLPLVSCFAPSLSVRVWGSKYWILFLDLKSSEDAKNSWPGLQKVNLWEIWKAVSKVMSYINYPTWCSNYCPGISGGKGIEALPLGSSSQSKILSSTVLDCKRTVWEVGTENHAWGLWACFPTGEVQAFYEDLNGRQYVNEVFNFSVDKLYDLLFTDSQFQRDFMEQRRFSGKLPVAKPSPWLRLCSLPGTEQGSAPSSWLHALEVWLWMTIEGLGNVVRSWDHTYLYWQ